MARNASLIKGSYYPSPPTVIEEIAKRIRPRIGATGFDPCSGNGYAILQLCDLLNAEAFGMELSIDRSTVLKALLGDNALAADFTRTMVSYNSFSFALVNPPFSGEVGGGRVEVAFLQRTTHLLTDGGVMIFIAPESVVDSSSVHDHFSEWYTNLAAMKFPDEVRNYNEVILMGTRRKHAYPVASMRWDWLDRLYRVGHVYDLPPGKRPKVFRVTEPTDTELARLVASSPLRFNIDRPADANDESNRPRPPMSLNVGHRAMLLASGFCNGLICPLGEEPHVIRGNCGKESYISSCTTEEDDDGNSTVKTTISEKPQLVVRVLDYQGTITTLE